LLSPSLSEFWNVFDRGVRLFLCCLCACIFLGVLISCSSDSAATGSQPKASGVITRNADQQTLAPISAVPPGSDQRPLLPGQSGATYTPDGMPALLPAKGVTADQLFAQKIKDDDKRMDRIENAIIDLKREFDAVKPAIIRLSAVESDMQDLITQLQTLTGVAPANEVSDNAVLDAQMVQAPIQEVSPVPVAPVELIEPARLREAPDMQDQETQAQPAAAQPPQGAAVTGIRSGVQNGAARIVLDMSEKNAYRRDLDNAEKILMIELPGLQWAAPKEGSFSKAPPLKSWAARAMADGTGTIVAIQLSATASIAYEKVLPGKDGTGSRLIIDLK